MMVAASIEDANSFWFVLWLISDVIGVIVVAVVTGVAAIVLASTVVADDAAAAANVDKFVSVDWRSSCIGIAATWCVAGATLDTHISLLLSSAGCELSNGDNFSGDGTCGGRT